MTAFPHRAATRPDATPMAASPKPTPRGPEHSSLTKAEIRAIILEIMG